MTETQSNQNRLPLSETQEMVRAGIKKRLLGAPAVIRAQTSHLAKAQGKNIRAAALCVCACDVHGTVRHEAVNAAVSLELLHLATLVHDDIIDNADKRRGIGALHKLFGDKAAVLCGDYLLSVALGYAFEISPQRYGRGEGLSKILSDSLSDVCLGELKQSENNRNFDLSERVYFKIIEGKTAALFRAAFLTGFILSDEDDDFSDLYARLGNKVGLMFQLSDDCLDYAADEKSAKKTVLSDYAQGVITLPLIYAMKRSEAFRAAAIAGLEPAELRENVLNLGGIDYVKRKIAKLLFEARTIIDTLAVNGEKRAALHAIATASAGGNAL